MRTAIIAFYEAFPPASGSATVSYNVAKYLPGEKCFIQFSFDNSKQELENNLTLINLKYVSDNYVIKMVNLFIQLPNLFSELKKFEPNLIVLEGASWSVYCMLLFDFLKLRKIKAKIVYHAHNVEFLLRKKKNNGFIAFLTWLAERRLMRKTDLATAVSKDDAAHFEASFKVKPVIFPNGVDAEAFDKINETQVQKVKEKYNLQGKYVLFMGLINFMPNMEALSFLIQKVFPMVLEDSPGTKLAVIGGDLDYKKEWIVNPGRIPFEDVTAFIKACDVCVAPIFSGSGTRLKILEYMAAGKPVVSTTKGAEGLAVKDGEDIVIANDVQSFAESIMYVLKHQDFAEKISRKGKELVCRQYSWQKIIGDFHNEVKRWF